MQETGEYLKILLESNFDELLFKSEVTMSGTDYTWREVLSNVLIALRGLGYLIPPEFDEYLGSFDVSTFVLDKQSK